MGSFYRKLKRDIILYLAVVLEWNIMNGADGELKNYIIFRFDNGANEFYNNAILQVIQNNNYIMEHYRLFYSWSHSD